MLTDGTYLWGLPFESQREASRFSELQNRKEYMRTAKIVSVEPLTEGTRWDAALREVGHHESPHVYAVRPDVRPRSGDWPEISVDLISDALPFGRLCYAGPDAVSNAVGFAKFFSRSHDAVIRVYDDAGDVIETHEHKSDFKEP